MSTSAELARPVFRECPENSARVLYRLGQTGSSIEHGSLCQSLDLFVAEPGIKRAVCRLLRPLRETEWPVVPNDALSNGQLGIGVRVLPNQQKEATRSLYGKGMPRLHLPPRSKEIAVFVGASSALNSGCGRPCPLDRLDILLQVIVLVQIRRCKGRCIGNTPPVNFAKRRRPCGVR